MNESVMARHLLVTLVEDGEAACRLCREEHGLDQHGPVSRCVDPSCKKPFNGESDICGDCYDHWEQRFSS